jgi:hypothetical protein
VTEPGKQSPLPPGMLPWYWLVALGLFLLGAAPLLYVVLGDMESEGSGVGGSAALVLLYRAGGKWLVAAVLGVFGLGALVLGVLARWKPEIFRDRPRGPRQ